MEPSVPSWVGGMAHGSQMVCVVGREAWVTQNRLSAATLSSWQGRRSQPWVL